MSKPFTGRCACGGLSYSVRGEPVAMNDCQCRQCQRDSGTGHSSYLTFAGAEVQVEGAYSCWEVSGDQGTIKSRAFCPTCGTLAFMRFPAMPSLFIIRAGTLDEPARYVPQMVFWTSAAQAWDRVDSAIAAFDRMPPQPG